MSSLSRRAWIAASLIVLSGCEVGPNFTRPAPPAVTTYTPKAAATRTEFGGQKLVVGSPVQSDWWRSFNSPALDAIVEEALRNNSDLQAARAALKAAHETYLSQRSVLLPTLDATVTTSKNKSSEYLSPVLNGEQFYYSLQNAELDLNYTLDLFGGLRRQVEGARAQEEAQRFQTEGVYLTLVTNVIVTAIQEASLRAQVNANEEAVRLDKDILNVMRQQLSLGQISRSDVLSQEAALAQAEAMLPPLRKQLATERDMLSYLVGRTPGEGLSQPPDLSDITLPRDLPLTVPSTLVEQRPDIRAAEANLHVSSAAVGQAIAARLPTLSLSASTGGSAGSWSTLFSRGTDFWSYGAGVTQPLFEGGALYRKQKAAEALLVQSEALYRSAVLAAFQNVADVLQALDVDEQALVFAKASKEAAGASLMIARRQLSEGQVAAIVVLNAEQALATANAGAVQAQATRLTDTAALFQALGGGWWSRPKAD